MGQIFSDHLLINFNLIVHLERNFLLCYWPRNVWQNCQVLIMWKWRINNWKHGLISWMSAGMLMSVPNIVLFLCLLSVYDTFYLIWFFLFLGVLSILELYYYLLQLIYFRKPSLLWNGSDASQVNDYCFAPLPSFQAFYHVPTHVDDKRHDLAIR